MVEVARLPKAELHLHLEGSVDPATLLELSRRYGTEFAAWSEDEVGRRLFRYRDFYDFLETYKTVCRHLRDAADYLQILEGLARYFQQENIRYAEIMYTPSIPWRFGCDGREILIALLERSRQIYSRQGIRVRWILDCVRQHGLEPARRTAELAREFRHQGVVGLGLGGDENSLPLQEYREVFGWARAHQLFLHVHAGEIGGPDQVWDAVRVLGANRIGHGIQAARDADLMLYLRRHAVSLDVCLTSNLKTGAWSPISENPFGLLFQRGVPITLSTDDPGLFQTSLNRELEKAIQFFRLSHTDVERLLLQAVHSAFLPHQEKMELMKQFQDEIQQRVLPEP